MRLRERDKRLVTFQPRVPLQEGDGTTSEGWGDPFELRGNVQPAGGRVMAEMYGERLAYMQVMYVEQKPPEKLESAGARLYTLDFPDYKVVAVRPWSGHFVIDMEAI
ncbi:hypothetical protein [Paenibacillus illinoisensis]|uniref:hypothetical protein n=1 Tax=Paenibacillus illinoisensis TaxID=59845 RepID=UPI000FDB46ED|nr:hypothetical protein [Paenibacillus illinoisensis]